MHQSGTISTKAIVWSAIVLFLVVGGLVVGLNYKKSAPPASNGTTASAVLPTQSGTPEDAQLALSIPSDAKIKEPIMATLYDAGPHGWHAVQSGGGSYMQYDGTTGLKYKVTATGDGSSGYAITIPDDMCGDIILPQGATPPAPKVIQITLTDASGKAIPGASPTKFDLKCDIYTLQATIKANPDKVLADGIAASSVTANFSVTGPAKFVNSKRIPRTQTPIIQTTPLGLMEVHFTTSLGVLTPNPANVKTNLNGDATVSVSSADAGIAKVIAQASGVGDAQVNVHFMPKITAVKQDFIPPTSPTNYEIKTIPVNPKDLTVDWKFLPAAGNNCGHMTGPASGLALTKNGFYHGPSDGFPDGCPEDWEHASQIQVTVTDKDGDSDTQTFSARDYEGQGFVKLP